MSLKLVTPSCCEKMLQAPSVFLRVDENSENPHWYSLAYTSSENLMALYDGKELKKLTHHIDLHEVRTKASFCPFCGTKAPEIVPREGFKSKICKPNDGYCDTCSKRLMCCRCYPPEWNWKPKESSMSYAIGKIVYGLDASEDSTFLSILERWLNENQDSDIHEIELFVEDASDPESFQENWCEKYYSGNGPTPAVFGVALRASISECSNISIAEINSISKVTPEILEKFNKKWNSLPESLRNKISSQLTPEVFILWTSS